MAGTGEGGSLWRVSDVAKLLDVDAYRVYELARNGMLPVVRLGRQMRFSPAAINKFIDSGGRGFSDDDRAA